MLRCGFSLLIVIVFVSTAAAQEPPYAAELRFVNQLRTRGYNDLALEYLDRLAKTKPTGDLARLLPLEVVKTRLMIADAEPEADKKIALFDQTRTDLEAFLKANPNESDAKMQLARVGQFQGKAQLDRALAMTETDEGRKTEIAKARKLLAQAAAQMEALQKDIKTEDAQNEATLEHALLLMEVARSFVDATNSKENDERGALLKNAINELDKVAVAFGQNNPNRWRANVWAARAYDMNDEPDKSKKAYTLVIERGDVKSKRLAYYFQLLGEHERLLSKADRKAPDCTAIITAANRWLTNYPKDKTSYEGLGCQWIIARQNYELGRLSGTNVAVRDNYWTTARKIIIDLEQTPSEFASKAQDLKIQILVEQKAFVKKIDELRTFDDLYMRALYEHHRLSTDDKAFDSPEKKKAQQQLVIDVLKKAVDRSKAPGIKVPANELDMARYLLTGYYYNIGSYREAATIGEEYVKANPKSGQASVAVVYAAQSLSTILEEKMGAPEEELKADRERLFAMARLMIDRWPGEAAGDFGRQIAALHLIRTGKEDEALKLGGDHARFQIGLARGKDNKHVEAIQYLALIQPSFQYYTQSQFRLALAAIQCERDKAEKPQGEKRTWNEIAIEALKKVPVPGPTADPVTNLIYVESKKTLASQLYGQNKFTEMDAIINGVLEKIDGLELDAEKDKAAAMRKEYRETLETLQLYSFYGKGDQLYSKGQYAETATLLDPLVDAIKGGKYPSLKKATTLRTGLFSLCMRANIQQSKIQRATDILDVWTAQTEEAEREKDLMGILSQLMVVINQQIKTLTDAKMTDELAKTKDSYAAFLSAMEKRQTKPSLDYTRMMALGYSTLGKHEQAADILSKLDKPKTGVKMPDEKESKLRAARVLYIRQLRLSGKDLDKAEAELQEILKDWGAKDINARIEELYLLESKKDYAAAFIKASNLNKSLTPLAEKDPRLHASYFDVYYLMCQNRYKFAVEKAQGGDREAVRQDALRLLKARLDGKINPELTEDARARFEKLLKEVEGSK